METTFCWPACDILVGLWEKNSSAQFQFCTTTYMLMNQLVNLTQHFVDFDGGARSTTLIATEHFVDPKKWLHSFGNPYQIRYFWSTWKKNNQLFTRLSRFFFLIRWITCKREEIKSKWIYILLQRTHQRMYQKAHVDRQSLFSHALLFCLTCQEESSVKKFFLQNL